MIGTVIKNASGQISIQFEDGKTLYDFVGKSLFTSDEFSLTDKDNEELFAKLLNIIDYDEEGMGMPRYGHESIRKAIVKIERLTKETEKLKK
jgi:hypothetical protein